MLPLAFILVVAYIGLRPCAWVCACPCWRRRWVCPGSRPRCRGGVGPPCSSPGRSPAARPRPPSPSRTARCWPSPAPCSPSPRAAAGCTCPTTVQNSLHCNTNRTAPVAQVLRLAQDEVVSGLDLQHDGQVAAPVRQTHRPHLAQRHLHTNILTSLSTWDGNMSRRNGF